MDIFVRQNGNWKDAYSSINNIDTTRERVTVVVEDPRRNGQYLEFFGYLKREGENEKSFSLSIYGNEECIYYKPPEERKEIEKPGSLKFLEDGENPNKIRVKFHPVLLEKIQC